MKSKLKRLTGSWDPFIPNTKQQLHFGPTHFIEVDVEKLEEPLRETILDEIERGVIVDERGLSPFEVVVTEREDSFHRIIDTCYLSEEPCKFMVNGSCPVPCIHDQTPPEESEEEEDEDTGYECTDCGAVVGEDDTICPKCGSSFEEADDTKTDEEDETTTEDKPNADEVDDKGDDPGKTLTPVGELLKGLPKDFDEAMERISAMNYSDVKDMAKHDAIKVKASGKKTEIVDRIRVRLQEVWGE